MDWLNCRLHKLMSMLQLVYEGVHFNKSWDFSRSRLLLLALMSDSSRISALSTNEFSLIQIQCSLANIRKDSSQIANRTRIDSTL